MILRYLVFCFSVLTFVGCRQKPQQHANITQSRIVSISPSTTEALFAIGAGPNVVGRSRYCNWPLEVEKLPQVGGYVDPNFEAILALRPTLVTGARGPIGPALRDRLEARGVATYFPPTESFDEIFAMIRGLGDHTGRREQADREVDAIQERIRAIQQGLGPSARPRTLFVFGIEPVSVAGPNSFADEMIRRAGGQNAVTEGSAYPTLGLERVLSLNPDVIIYAAMGESQDRERITKATPGWNKVRAVIDGRVISLRDESVLRPGPRIADGLLAFARAIHPALVVPSHP
jgi:iron complex transport system substrate-binding protein